MNNDDNSKSSRANTTPFNNHNDNNNPFERLRNNNYNKINHNNNDYLNLSDDERRQVSKETVNSSLQKNNNNDSLKNNTQNNRKLGQGSVANNLRSKLNTIPSNLDDAKKKAVEKGAEALKKSANPLAKAAGIGLGAYQKHKDKKEKEQEEQKEEENQKENENQDEISESSETKEERRGRELFKKMLPIIGIVASFLLILLVLLAVFSPVITVSSWFTSLFHHKSEDASSYTIYNEKDSENYKAEQDYNNAILGSKDGSVKGIIPEYQEKYGVTIDWYLLNALITYRYSSDNGNLYSSDNSEEIDEEELNNRLEELQNNSEDENSDFTSSDNSGVDYSQAAKKIKSFASLMIVKENGSYTTDTEKNGKVYNNVLNSNTFKKYYKLMFKDQTEESYKKILDEIYDFAEFEREWHKIDSPTNGGIVSSSIQVYLQTCEQPYKKTTINGISVWNNPSSTGSYPQSLNLRDYIKGVIYGEIGGHATQEYKESVKALMVSALTFAIKHKESGFNLKNGNMYMPAGDCKQLCCDPNSGCTYKMDGSYGTSYSGPNRFSSYKFVRQPMSQQQSQFLDELLDEVFGLVMVKKGVTAKDFMGSSSIAQYAGNYLANCNPGTCLSQNDSFNDAKNGFTYIQILNKYYSNVDYGNGFDLINISEGLYYESTGENINGTSSGLNENYHYHQGDSEWRNLKLCGSGAISSNGCNITSAAMAISILKNQRITPAVLQSRQGSISSCSPSSRPQMIMNFAKLYGLSATSVNKSNSGQLNDMLKKLATGNYTAVARLAPNSGIYSTSNGHYIAIVGVKTEGSTTKLLVWDPGSKSSARDNAWIDVNYLVKYLQSSYSFILIGK